RIEKLKSALKTKHLEAIIVLSDYNRRYLSGFTGTSGALIITNSEKLLLTDFRYIEQATDQAAGFKVIKQQGQLIESIKSTLEDLNVQNVGFEGNLVSYDTYLQLSKSYISLISISGLIERIREVKDEQEIANIQKAAQIVDDAYEYILTVAKAGMTELELKAKLESKMLELGSEGPSFNTIVASGVRGALPHGVASDKVINQGELITLDYGAYYNGYASDITRTFAIGERDAQLKEIYNIVLQAKLKGIEAAKQGMTGRELDAVARDYITEKRYSEAFGHTLGHCLELNVNEGPNLSKKSESALELNNCVTIESGIYLDGIGGVRIEDNILITKNGCERFTKSSKDLIIV